MRCEERLFITTWNRKTTNDTICQALNYGRLRKRRDTVGSIFRQQAATDVENTLKRLQKHGKCDKVNRGQRCT